MYKKVTTSSTSVIERVPHFGNMEKKRCYDILQDILASEELERNVTHLLKKPRTEKAPVTIPMPKPQIEIKTEDSGLASSIISPASIKSSNSEPVDAIMPEAYLRSTFDFKDTYKGPFWKPPAVKTDEIYLVMVNSSNGETWVQARLLKEDGPICTVRVINTQSPAKVFWQFFAFAEKAPQFLKIGQRVIAPLRQNSDTGEVIMRRKAYKLGTVAEYPAIENKYRYLVFFDSGDWCYVNMEDVRPLVRQRKHAWRDIPAPQKFALRMYVKGLFRPMVRFESGQIVKMLAEKVSKRKCECLNRNVDNSYTVLSVDCSLVALYHRIDRTTFLMHRGYPFLQKLDM